MVKRQRLFDVVGIDRDMGHPRDPGTLQVLGRG